LPRAASAVAASEEHGDVVVLSGSPPEAWRVGCDGATTLAAFPALPPGHAWRGPAAVAVASIDGTVLVAAEVRSDALSGDRYPLFLGRVTDGVVVELDSPSPRAGSPVITTAPDGFVVSWVVQTQDGEEGIGYVRLSHALDALGPAVEVSAYGGQEPAIAAAGDDVCIAAERVGAFFAALGSAPDVWTQLGGGEHGGALHISAGAEGSRCRVGSTVTQQSHAFGPVSAPQWFLAVRVEPDADGELALSEIANVGFVGNPGYTVACPRGALYRDVGAREVLFIDDGGESHLVYELPSGDAYSLSRAACLPARLAAVVRYGAQSGGGTTSVYASVPVD
jgi:hypothetical protein